MDYTAPYYDYCVPYNRNESIMREICKELVALGYKTIAIDQEYDHTAKAKEDNKKGRGLEIFPEPNDIKYLQEEFKNKLKIYQRLTIIYTDAAVAHAMNNSLNLKKYQILAGQPQTEAALTHCLTSFDGDLISLEPTTGAKLFLNRKAYQVAIQRRMHFEIKYSPVIVDSTLRKDAIKMAHNLGVRGISKNVVLSSGARSAFEIRSPQDVANLSFIFGLAENQGKNAVDKTCRQLHIRSESRRVGKTVMMVKSIGPVVFSDCSDDADDAEEADEAADNSDEDDGHENSNNNEPKNKKIKLS